MNDTNEHPPDDVREALRQLPRVAAGDDFAARVLARSANAGGSRRWPRLAAAALLLVALGAGLQITLDERREGRQRERRAALAQRHAELQRDLEALRTRAASTPKLYLGGASDIDFVLDLEPWMEPSSSIQPASFSNADRRSGRNQP